MKFWLTNIHLMVEPKLIFGSIWYNDLTIQKYVIFNMVQLLNYPKVGIRL